MQAELNERNGYMEQRTGRKLTVNWEAAVVVYARKVAMYGYMLGIGLAATATFYAKFPETGKAWLYTIIIIFSCGLTSAGFFGVLAIIIKDLYFPYKQPYEKTRSLPLMGAPDELKPQPLMRQMGNTIKYGKLKLSPERLLALARAILVNGEDKISQRKLAEWNVVSTKESAEAKQLKADIERLGYARPSGNGQLLVKSVLRDYLAGKFPTLSPYSTNGMPVSAGDVDRHRRQTPLG